MNKHKSLSKLQILDIRQQTADIIKIIAKIFGRINITGLNVKMEMV